MRRGGLVLAMALLSLPASAPGEPERAFDWTVGLWEGVRRDGADGTEAPMTMRVEAVLGGAGQIRRIEVAHDGAVYRGVAVQIFDRDAGIWRRQYANDVRGRFAPLEGRLEGDRSIWSGTSPGRSGESRLVSERTGPGRWRRTMSISGDGGKTWRVLWIDELARDQGQSQPNTPPVRSP